MTGSLVSVGIFLALLVCLPFALKWLKQRIAGGAVEVTGQSRFISAVAVGPQQRVVTVEVGPEGRRVWLTLGITPQNITCLHRSVIDDSYVKVGALPSAPREGAVSTTQSVSSDMGETS